MQIIAPDINRGLCVGELLGEDGTLEETTITELMGDAVASAGYGLVLATADRQIVYANDAAKTLMRASSGLRCEHGCISATDLKTSRRLRVLIFATSRQADTPAHGGSLVVRNESGVPLLVVHVVPLSPRCAILSPGPVAGLFIIERQRGSTDRINVFADLFTLTPAEARVVSELVSGGGLAIAATRLNIARSTVRTHFKHILEKTDTHRQAELVRVFYETTIHSYGLRRTGNNRRDGVGCEPAPMDTHT